MNQHEIQDCFKSDSLAVRQAAAMQLMAPQADNGSLNAAMLATIPVVEVA